MDGFSGTGFFQEYSSVELGVADQEGELEKRNDANARFATIVESSPSAVIGFNLKGEVVAWSRGAEIVLGYTAAETLGHSMRAMIPANQLDMESAVEERLLWGNSVENYETVRRCKDQSMKDVMVAVATLRDTSGRIVGYSRVERDITQNVKDRVALRDVQEQLKVIVEHLSEGLIISDSESRLVHWNPAALRMHGMESNDDWNRLLPEFSEIYQLATMDGQVVGTHHWPIARVLQGEVVHDLEMRVRHLH